MDGNGVRAPKEFVCRPQGYIRASPKTESSFQKGRSTKVLGQKEMFIKPPCLVC